MFLSIVSTSAFRVAATSNPRIIMMSVACRKTFFHASSLAQQHGKRFTLGTTPARTTKSTAQSRIQYNFSQPSPRSRVGGHNNNNNHTHGGGHRGTTTNNTTYPTYLYVGGGVVVVGTMGLYFHYQNFAPMTHRRRWIASSPEFEKEMGDEVRH
jgi:hypothetical protein